MPDAAPVFVDLTGRRRRGVRVAAVGASASLLGVGALVVAALFGVPVGPSAYLPEPDQPPPAASTSQQAPAVGPAPNTETPTEKRPAPDDVEAGSPVVPTSGPATAPATTTTTTAGKGKPDTPPGRPTDLPTPPGHTR